MDRLATLEARAARLRAHVVGIAAAQLCHLGGSLSCADLMAALFFIALSRAGVGVSSVLNMSQLLRIVPNSYRGRVFSTLESCQWSVMMLSMMSAGIASQYWDPRTIGAVAGALSSTTQASLSGRLRVEQPRN